MLEKDNFDDDAMEHFVINENEQETSERPGLFYIELFMKSHYLFGELDFFLTCFIYHFVMQHEGKGLERRPM